LRTEFTAMVSDCCRQIPPGATISYADLAAAVGRPGAARAVANVMRTNPVPIIIPCHRVVGRDGKMHGYSAAGGIATPDVPPAPMTADADASAAFDRSIIAQLDQRKRELDVAAQRHDFAAAMRAYDAMRTATLYLHDPELQAGAARKLRTIHGLLTRLRHAAGDGDHHLARTVP